MKSIPIARKARPTSSRACVTTLNIKHRMNSLPQLLQQATNSTWLFVPSAILLGALHGLEPGHSKTMMAAFIIAIRGTVWQAVLLGVAATSSPTIVGGGT